jgi:hypothetical protein
VKGKKGKANPTLAYFTEIPLTLKAGQKLSITASVTGQKRSVSLALRDASGAIVEKIPWATKTAQLQIEEVSASGKFHILVFSDQIGAFTLRAAGPAAKAEKLDVAALEEKIKRLERELEETKALLKKAKADAVEKE